MDDLTVKQAAARSKKIREHYRSLEMKHHGSEWSVADRMGIDSEEALENFLSTTEKRFDL